jgi:dipeptidyl aminopeptidase/acylaminoacyl peptidase
VAPGALGGLALSPDGTRAACTVAEPDVAGNALRTSIWLLPVHGRVATQADHLRRPGRHACMVARRHAPGLHGAPPPRRPGGRHPRNYHVIDARGGEARRVSDFVPGVEAFRWLPDGRGIVFVSWLWPGLRSAAAQARRLSRSARGCPPATSPPRASTATGTASCPGPRARLCLLNLASGRVQDLFEGTALELPRADPAWTTSTSPTQPRLRARPDREEGRLQRHRTRRE